MIENRKCKADKIFIVSKFYVTILNKVLIIYYYSFIASIIVGMIENTIECKMNIL